MKKLVCVTGIILISCLLVTTFFAPTTSATEKLNTTSQSISTTDESEQVYVMKIDKGYIKIYKKNDSKVYLDTHTLASNLPKSDILSLEKGIEIQGKNNLRKAVEAYCS